MAIALIGSPPIVILDEPSNGVDPFSRRKFWRYIKKMQSYGMTFLIASHSMSECESLCDRLGILLKGDLICEGTLQSLKSCFQSGYNVVIKLKTDHNDDINALLEQLNAMDGVLQTRQHNLLHYRFTNKNITEVFEGMDDMKVIFESIEDYSITESAIEDIFHSLLLKQSK